MNHLSDIDAQLGLAPYEGFSDADGRGAAKAALAAGMAACGLRHPFSKKKRQACVAEKKNIYNAKIRAIEAALNPPKGIAESIPMDKSKPALLEKSLPPTSPRPESPIGSRAQEEQAAAAAAATTEGEGGMNTTTKIAIGVAAAVVLIGGFMYMRKK
jgi:hypothetical protein